MTFFFFEMSYFHSMRNRAHFLSLVILLNVCCNQEPAEKPLFQKMESTGIRFSNDISNTPDFNIFSYRNFYNGGGVAIGDINNDGLSDVYFTANMSSNKLYLNKGNFEFEDISEKAGITEKEKWSTGVVMVDINNDGWLDIYVCNAGYKKGMRQENTLFINNHDLTFTEKAKEYGLANDGYTTHAAFFDYDLDGDLDCYILNNSFIPVNTLNYSNKRELRAKDWPVEDFLKGGGSYLMRNDNGKFVDISEEAGIYGSLISFGLGVTVGDVNGDHYPDIYVSNDFFERDYLYINQKNGKFSEQVEQWAQHISMSSMGADMGDINNDGYPEIFVTDMLPDDEYRLKTTSSFENIDMYRLKVKQGFYHQFMQNTLQVNNRNGKFMETGFYSGVAASDWSWGALIFDADNDGLSDIYVCNGIYNDVTDQDFIDFFADEVSQRMVLTGKKEEVNTIINKMPSTPVVDKAFRNQGNLKFEDAGKKWGFTDASFSNGAAYSDLDNDGDLDLVVSNVNARAFIYKNNSREQNKNSYIAISLKGKGANPYAVGSTVKVFQGNQVITREVIPSRGFQSSVDYKVIIGLGKKLADSMHIIWPDRTVSKFNKPEINKLHQITEEGSQFDSSGAVGGEPILSVVTQQMDKHIEDDFIDFYYDRNIPAMLSREGPKAAVGDVNGDGLPDIYIAGASGQGGQLYLQEGNKFVKKADKSFGTVNGEEEVAPLFFDCDKDGDQDLYVGPGGNNQPSRSKRLQHKLFRNDGKGKFTLDTTAFPPNESNISVAIAEDFDKDGDLDLFVGGRSVPYNYGPSPTSYVFINDGKGKFKVNPEISAIGLVTSAAWTGKELVVVGEWMGPKIFSFSGDHFVEVKSDLNELQGLWQSVASADLDKDGDQDLILGNVGENFYLKPSTSEPVKLWINDFDNNGLTEKIISRTVNGKEVPVFLKRELTDQVVSLKKQNLKYKDFANKSVQDLFPQNVLKNSTIKTFNYSSSVVAYNEGNGNYNVVKFPETVQLSCVNAILCKDVNGDGLLDIVMGGNNFGLQPQFSRLDASYGHVLINDGKGNFRELLTSASGLELRGQIRDIKLIEGKRQPYLLFLQNNEYPVLYKINTKNH